MARARKSLSSFMQKAFWSNYGLNEYRCVCFVFVFIKTLILMETLWGYGWKLWTPSSISSSKAVLLTEMEKFRFLSWHWTPRLPGEPALLKRGDISKAKKCGHMCCLLHFMIHTITFHTFLMFISWPFIILKMKGRVGSIPKFKSDIFDWDQV